MFELYNERNRTYFLERKGRVHMKKRENEMQYRTQIEGDKEIIRNILDDMKVMGHVSMLRGMAEGLYEEEKKQGN